MPLNISSKCIDHISQCSSPPSEIVLDPIGELSTRFNGHLLWFSQLKVSRPRRSASAVKLLVAKITKVSVESCGKLSNRVEHYFAGRTTTLWNMINTFGKNVQRHTERDEILWMFHAVGSCSMAVHATSEENVVSTGWEERKKAWLHGKKEKERRERGQTKKEDRLERNNFYTYEAWVSTMSHPESILRDNQLHSINCRIVPWYYTTRLP